MSFFLLVLFLLLSHNGWLLPPCSAKIEPFDIAADAYSLLAFRDHFLLTTNVSNILRTNWTSASNATTSSVVCHWIGVTCGARHQRVVALDLGDMGLTGTIPSHFGNLSFLRVLNISNNKFHGQLPKEMAGLHRLSSIDVSFNSLSGNIPAWYGLLPQLKYLNIHNNSFTGPIPPFLSNASKLKILDISSNLVNGMIPVELGNLHNLQHLKMSFNQLTGEIPLSIFNLTLLEIFSLYSNGISGGLPEDMCTSLPKLRLLDLAYNELEGHIQSSLQFCARLEKLSLAYNKFHGPLTGALENLTMLNLLYLTGNDLKVFKHPAIFPSLQNIHLLSHHVVPAAAVPQWLLPLICLAKKTPFNITTDTSALVAFRDHFLTTTRVNNILRNNWISYGPNISCVANSICHWVGVTWGARHHRVVALNLSDMGLAGTIPSHFGNLSFLRVLDISNNKFHGQLPQEMAGLGRLTFIDVGFNSLSGNIPAWFGLLPQLKYVYLQNNSFTGLIPPSLSNCSKLEVLITSNNSLTGVIPQELGNLRNLKFLSMVRNRQSGEIPPSIFNISSLDTLSLAINGFSGSLPEDICTSLSKQRFFCISDNELEGWIASNFHLCSRIEVLSLSYNKLHGVVPSALGNLTQLNSLYLGGNNFKGDIPSELARLVNLKELGLGSAGLGGSIPPSIFMNMTSLESLYLQDNSLSGSIPNEIGNCTSIIYIEMGYNQLTGQVPEHIGRLHKLEFLSLHVNNLGGHVPTNLFNITSLRFLDLAENHLTRHLPANTGSGLPNLEELYLSGNRFSGTIPDSISNSSGLTILSLASNQFTGSHPTSLGNLRLLNWLSIDDNNLRLNAKEFIVSLSFLHLRLLGISSNQVNGPLPSSFGNLTSSLYVLGAQDCGIIGKIPEDILNMSNLQTLILSSNHLVGSLPHTLSRLSNMDQLYASDNNLSGLIPDDICRLPRLGALELHANKFFGPLPDCLGNMTSLRTLKLHINELSGSIPASLWPLRDILQLDLSSNSFTGYLPQDIGTLRAATYINISSNQLSGTLPSTIGSVQTLNKFSLAHNKFEGSIPESFGKLLSMEELDLSYNNISGEIPKSLQTLSFLKILNLSFNQLSGEIPSTGPFKNLTYLSFVSNKALCGSPRFHVPQCQSDGSSKHLTKRRMVLLFVYAMIGMTLLTLVVLAALYVILKCRKKQHIPWVEDIPVALERVSYHELLRATNSFDDSNLLGKGSFGSVYKAVFANGRTLAVKVFHFQVERALKSFDTECEMLRNIRHKNLTKVISSCTNLDFMALVLEYMPNGSLEKWLYSHNYLLDVKQRLDVMIDVASALEYLHIGYSVPVVHCDLKPGNVLLDEDMVAHVSDFGISKFLKEEGGIVQTNTLATVGYTAPEYGREGIVSTKCDVYSFGIMLMEVFTRRRPTEEMFSGDLDLKFWVNQSLPDRVMEIIDENLLRQEENQDSAMVQCVSLILDVASNCSSNLPDERMDMKDVLSSLKKIKLRLHADLA